MKIFLDNIYIVMFVAKLGYEHKQARSEKTPKANSPGD